MYAFDLDTSLIEIITEGYKADWTIRDAVEGVQIFGGIGSGKTSGSGRMLALKYLKFGFGGLVLTVKPDEKKMWQEYCRLAGREQDLIILERGGQHRFNFLEYVSALDEDGIAITENIVQVLKTVIRASEEKSGGKTDDPFWESALDMLIFNAIDLCTLAYGRASVQQMYDIALTAPKKPEEGGQQGGEDAESKPFHIAFTLAQQAVDKEVDDFLEAMTDAEHEEYEQCPDQGTYLMERLPNARLLKFVDQFFVETYRELNDKTRSIIEFSFTGFLFRLLKEPIYSLFCNGASTLKPDDCLEGKIILINLPVKLYHKVGRDCQVMFKYIWQQAMEKRQVNIKSRPIFLWADEAQNFLHEHDADYQATARSSRIATVYISQNLPNYHANMGGVKSEFRVKSFLGTLGTKIFHANADLETNRYASDLVGEGWTQDDSRTVTVSGNYSSGKTTSYNLRKIIRPEQLVSLKTGGTENKLVTEGLVHRQGKELQANFNHKIVRFRQDYKV